MDLMPYAGEIISSLTDFWRLVLIVIGLLLAWIVLSGFALGYLIMYTKYTPPYPSNDRAEIINLFKFPIIALKYIFKRRRDP